MHWEAGNQRRSSHISRNRVIFGDMTSDRIVKMEVGSRFFVGGGGLREEVGLKFVFGRMFKNRWGLNFLINYRRKRYMT